MASRGASVDALAQMLHHPDPSQLIFQIREIAEEEAYLRHGVTVGKDDVVVDVGANVGVAAAFFALICGAGTVHCFEPVKPVFEVLQQNVGHVSACILHQEGLSSSARRAPITYYPNAAAMSGLYADPSRDCALVRTVLLNSGLTTDEADRRLAGMFTAQTLGCELRRLSSFLREEGLARVDLLKIDVEKAELDVLDGVDDGDWPKIQQVVVEVHDDDGRAQTIRTRLTSEGFRVVCEQEKAMRGTSIRMLYGIRNSTGPLLPRTSQA